MEISNSLLRIKGKRLKLFADVISSLRPGVYIQVSEWQKMSPEKRRQKMAAFFSMHKFSADEHRRIKRAVFKIKVPVKPILICVAIGAIAFLSYKIYRFYNLPRVYTIGNDVPVTSAPGDSSRAVKRVDIFGQSNSGKSTASSLLLFNDTGSFYMVQNDQLIDWLLGKSKNYYVSKIPFVTKKTEYEEYERIFQQAKSKADFDQLSALDRIAIKSCIESNNALFGASVEILQDTSGAYKPFVVANGTGTQHYIFLCLKKQNNQVYNVQVTCDNGIFLQHKEIDSNGKTFAEQLEWKMMTGGQYPIIYFYHRSVNQTYQSLFPPYAIFLVI